MDHPPLWTRLKQTDLHGRSLRVGDFVFSKATKRSGQVMGIVVGETPKMINISRIWSLSTTSHRGLPRDYRVQDVLLIDDPFYTESPAAQHIKSMLERGKYG